MQEDRSQYRQHVSRGREVHDNSAPRHIISSLIAGGIAGSLAKTFIAPFDRTKINFQVSRTEQYSFKAAMKFVKLTYRQNGFFALYRGNSATMARVVPFSAIQFMTHKQCKQLLDVDKNGRLTPERQFLAGSLAGLTATCITYPLDTTKARLAVYSRTEYPTLISVFVNIYRDQGVKPLYRGMWPSIVGVSLYGGLSFMTYETLKLKYEEKLGPTVSPLFGSFAGLIGQSSTYPLDIVRRRMQTGKNPSNWGISKTLWSIFREEGLVKGLYKGFSMNCVKGPIAAGVSFTTNDYVFKFLKRITD